MHHLRALHKAEVLIRVVPFTVVHFIKVVASRPRNDMKSWRKCHASMHIAHSISVKP